MFETTGFIIKRNVIPSEVAAHIYEELTFLENYRQARYGGREIGYDGLVNNALSVYGPFATEMLLEKLKPIVEEIAQTNLLPTYSYCRNYYNGSEMPKHKDRDSCEYSMSINFGSVDGDDWPLHMIDKTGEHHEIVMAPGDAVVYQGHLCEHWREPFKGQRMSQGFLFWVNAFGPHAHEVYDGRPGLGFPKRAEG